jgi:hypothetical protein
MFVFVSRSHFTTGEFIVSPMVQVVRLGIATPMNKQKKRRKLHFLCTDKEKSSSGLPFQI